MNTSSFIVSCLCILLYTKSTARILRRTCMGSAWFGLQRPGKRLIGASVKIFRHEDDEACQRHCYLEPRCKSYNIHKNGDCELNSKSITDLTDGCIESKTNESHACALESESKWRFVSTSYTRNLIGPNCDKNHPCGPDELCEDSCECPGFTCTKCSAIENFPCPNECPNTPCQNGGTCTFSGKKFQCTCAKMYSGQFCETQQNPCLSNPCPVGKSCTDRFPDYSCSS